MSAPVSLRIARAISPSWLDGCGLLVDQLILEELKLPLVRMNDTEGKPAAVAINSGALCLDDLAGRSHYFLKLLEAHSERNGYGFTIQVLLPRPLGPPHHSGRNAYNGQSFGIHQPAFEKLATEPPRPRTAEQGFGGLETWPASFPHPSGKLWICLNPSIHPA